jgi:hypothetical protein
METPQEYHYTYYSYEEWGMGYFGSRTCKCLPEEDINYFGSFSDKNFKPTQKIILKSDYATREAAYADEIILQEYYKVVENPHFANKAYQTTTKFSYDTPLEQRILNGKKGGEKAKELGLGFHSLTKEQLSENSKKMVEKHRKTGTGLFTSTNEQRGKGGLKNKEQGSGIFSLTEEEKQKIRSEAGKIGGKIGGNKTKELGVGICGLSKEQRSEIGKKSGKIGGKSTSSQRWMCLETGHISTPGGLSRYQKHKDIDTSQRVRVS